MKNSKLIYWTTTGIISLMMLYSAFMYLTNPEIKEGFTHLGYRDYFRIELAWAKALGAIALLLPMVPRILKEFAYAGFTITFISAFIAHMASGDPFSTSVMPLVFLGVLGISYIYRRRPIADPAAA